jgi:NTP pyrophosphatase (non-canonical NTP hydrolase)
MYLNDLIHAARSFNGIVLKGHPEDILSLSFRSNEMQSEVGELGDVVKKIERLRLGIPGTKPENADMNVLRRKLNEEFGDSLISIGLLADALCVDLDFAFKMKTEELLERYAGLGLLEGSTEHARRLRKITSSLGRKPADVDFI